MPIDLSLSRTFVNSQFTCILWIKFNSNLFLKALYIVCLRKSSCGLTIWSVIYQINKAATTTVVYQMAWIEWCQDIIISRWWNNLFSSFLLHPAIPQPRNPVTSLRGWIQGFNHLSTICPDRSIKSIKVTTPRFCQRHETKILAQDISCRLTGIYNWGNDDDEVMYWWWYVRIELNTLSLLYFHIVSFVLSHCLCCTFA